MKVYCRPYLENIVGSHKTIILAFVVSDIENAPLFGEPSYTSNRTKTVSQLPTEYSFLRLNWTPLSLQSHGGADKVGCEKVSEI